MPADTAVALGAFLSHGGLVSASAVFVITWTTNVTSATAVYAGAYTLGRRFFTGRIGRRLLRPHALAYLETLYARHGLWGIFLSRFVPGLRAVVPPFAGVARLAPLRALVPMALASAIWYGILTYVAVKVAGQLEQLIRLVDRVNLAALIVVAGVLALAVGLWYVRRRHGRERAERMTAGGHHRMME